MNPTVPARTTVRKFVAATSREALRLVREALGADAIVLTNRAMGDGVEIVAMADGDVTQAVAQAAPMAAPAPVFAPAPTPVAPAPAFAAAAPAPSFAMAPAPVMAAAPAMPAMPAPHFAAHVQPLAVPASVAPAIATAQHAPATAAPQTDVLLSELHSMRGMLEEQLASGAWNERQRKDPVRGRLLRTMLGAGFSARLSKAMLEKLPGGQSYAEGMAFARAELMRALPVHADEDALMAAGGVYALMGPTGVGKTTTTAKLAARCVMRFGADKLALVTTDSYRIGAYEQLRIYGQILNVPVYAVKDAADLHLVLQDLQGKHMVLIDTVGMSQRDRAVSDQIAMLGASQRPVKRLLLLNATSHGDTLNEVVHAYRHAGAGGELAGCIFTKVDEATHPGALIDTVIRHRLPVHYVSSGQKVPENLMCADRAQLVDGVFQPRRHNALFDAAEVEAPPNEGPSERETQAQAEADRLRAQYQNLIRAMTHDAQELAGVATALAAAPIGFEAARSFWRQAEDEQAAPKAVLQALLAQARGELAAHCDRHVLALSGQVALRASESGDAYACHSSLLLSDRSGQPLSAPNQWLSTAAAGSATQARRKANLRPVQWLAEQDLGKSVVHWLPRLPALPTLVQWQAQGLSWLARAPGLTAVIDAHTGVSSALSRMDFRFGPTRAVLFRGKPALRSEAHAQVLLRVGGERAPLKALRCVAVQLCDPRGQKLARQYLLSNVGDDVSAPQLAQWQSWATEAEPCLRLMRAGVQLAGGLGEPGDSDMVKRLLVAGQVGTTVWRLLHARDAWAERTRMLLNQLIGRPARAGRPLTGNALYGAVVKLFVLLDALGTEAGVPAPQAGTPEPLAYAHADANSVAIRP